MRGDVDPDAPEVDSDDDVKTLDSDQINPCGAPDCKKKEPHVHAVVSFGFSDFLRIYFITVVLPFLESM